jgi:hypothetical protein
LALSVIVLAIVAAVAPTGDPDLWWHLRTGQLALEQPARLAFDPFSYSRAGAPWRYHDLIADMILYRGFATLGYAWFVVLKVKVALTIALALWLVQRRDQRSALAALAGTAALLVALRLVERPNLFTVALFPLTLALLERARRVLHRPPRVLAMRLAVLVLTGWVWICLHRAGVLAIALVAGLFVWTSLCALLPAHPSLGARPGRVAVGLTALAALASLALALLNPSGMAALTSSVGVSGASILRTSISEWQRLGPAALARAFPLPLALGALGTLVVTERLRARGATPLHLAILALGWAAVFDSVRWVPYLATAGVVLSVLALAAPASTVLSRLSLRPLPALVFVAALAAVWEARVAPFALGEDRARTAHGAVDFLSAHGLSGKVANTLEHGGYLIWRAWPSVQVLIDGRNETVYPPELLARAIASDRDRAVFNAMRAEDGATLVVAGNAPGRQTHFFLAADPAWAMVDWSEAAIVWVRLADHPELAPLRFSHVDPRSIDGSVVRALGRGAATPAEAAALRTELERMVLASPDSVRVLVALAIFHHLRSDPAARDRVMQRLEEIAPDHPAVRELRRRF